MNQLTVNQLIERLHSAVDPQDRDHVYVRMVIHGYENPTVATKALYTSGGTGYPFVNIVGEERNRET